MPISFTKLANESIRHLAPYQPGKPISEVQRELGITDVIKLASNENPLGPSPKALAAIQNQIHELALYPDASGHDLKQAIAREWQLTPNQITLGAGSEALFVLIGQAFVQPGQDVIISQYGFATFNIATRIFQGNVVTVPAKDWGHDLEATLKAVTSNTRLIFLANPNNPTAAWHDHDTLVKFFERLPNDIIVILDEAYAEFMTEEKNYPDSKKLLGQYPNIIITRTFSKLHGLAGLRIGYAISHPEAADMLNRVKLPFNVASTAMVAAIAALSDQEHIDATLKLNREGMQYLKEELGNMHISFLPPAGNFITIDVAKDGVSVYQALLREGVIVRPLAGYGLPSFLRVSIGTMAENQRFIQSLRKVL